MRNLEERGALGVLSSEVFSVLQVGAINESLLPNLKNLTLWPTTGGFVPFVPLSLSPGTTVINIGFNGPDLPKVVIASIAATFPILCPNLERITLRPIPRDPMITAGVPGMLLATNRNTIRSFEVDSPLTEEGRELIQATRPMRVTGGY